ncbi:ABC transporter permease [Thalassobaculum fulvum]|uniref:ABC transporter permease n=1 Tax=Thalassobaculum fulvum TaxID=1633335 RepID=A0A918XTX5_9PROT|nr:ABC transporter permease [Thalassobaculum fulvum]GHD54749.1 ABC transporter permease [Thalassobaculum fulvum]
MADAHTSAPGLLDPLRRFLDGDVWASFKRSPVTVGAAAVTLLYFLAAAFGPWVAPHDPFDLAKLDLLDSLIPPAWMADGDPRFLLGTDDQGRDMLSAIIYGSRVSLLIGFASVLLSMVLGIALGLLSGFVGGAVDAFIMRMAEIQLSFPAILVALLINGVVIGYFKTHPEWQVDQVTLAYVVLVLSIGLSNWVQYARTVRGSTLVERGKEYVQAAHVIGIHPAKIMLRHILPNVMGPVLVIATIQLALAVIAEATLSFLGVGVPPTEPSLGTLIRVGNDYLFSGEWWITIFPGAALAILVLAVNLLGDWLRDALNPKLR